MTDCPRPEARALVHSDGSLLLTRSATDEARWMLPGGRLGSDAGYRTVLERTLASDLGFDVTVHEPVTTFKRIGATDDLAVVTVFRATTCVTASDNEQLSEDWRWVTPSQVSDLPLSPELEPVLRSAWEPLKSPDDSAEADVTNDELLSLAKAAARRTVKLPRDRKRSEGTHIGATVLTEANKTYTGTIIETRDKMQTVHAERLAIAKAVSEGTGGITKLAVYSSDSDIWPCGACLQFLYEFSSHYSPTILVSDHSGERKEEELANLYKYPWPPDLHDS